ncbi:hypothetical protein BCR34DRAFT_646152 [Clohesyomyces aquaticus]|uniref:Uncharacterized protein n=1 Tax=Clohesyomyces aquaticus TaxID=1231657 RepID=A0A1Y1ZWC6_9PLEO|nr:hypothetical protein BCR34DRAFT_646152 [Clohesyomyces aquaticus]
MLAAPRNDGLAWNLILSVFWNSAEPFAASSNMTVHIWPMLFNTSTFHLGNKTIYRGIILVIISLLIGISTIVGGIMIPQMMEMGPFAPAHPEVAYVPNAPEIGALDDRFGMLFSAAAVRAVGSAEASKVTLRSKVRIYQEKTDQSTPEKPYFTIDCRYNLTGVEMGLRHSLGLVHSVQGKCWTEYGWLHHSNATPEYDVYHVWNLSNNPYPVESNRGPASTELGLLPAMYPDHVESLPINVSYALVYHTSHLPSKTASNDAMYMTESMPEKDPWSKMYDFRVKAERPALSCWQTTNFCIHGDCGSVFDLVNKGVPPGLQMILGHVSVPMVLSIPRQMGPSALLSFYSNRPGSDVDAESSKAFSDMERMVLGAYLLTRNVFRRNDDGTILRLQQCDAGSFWKTTRGLWGLCPTVRIRVGTLADSSYCDSSDVSRSSLPQRCPESFGTSWTRF